jgi:membrane protease YdiL (CAAX protease family)
MTMTSKISQRYPVSFFVVTAFAFSWVWWFAAVRFGVLGDILPPVTAIASFGPALAALLVTRTGEVSGGPHVHSRHHRTLALLTLVLGGIFTLKLLTGGRDAFRDVASAPDITLDATNLFFVALVILIAAWAFASARSPDRGIRARMRTLLEWKVGVWPWIFTLAVMPVVYLLGAGLSIVLGGTIPTPAYSTYEGTGAVFILVVAFLFGAVFGGGNEELGWRGFMLPALQERYSPLVASLIIAVAWSLWHLPLHIGGFYEGGQLMSQPSVAVAMTLRTLQMTPLAILFTWLYNQTGGNLLLMVSLHATVSLSALIVPYTFLSVVPGILLVVGLVLHGRMWKQRPDSTVQTRREDTYN